MSKGYYDLDFDSAISFMQVAWFQILQQGVNNYIFSRKYKFSRENMFHYYFKGKLTRNSLRNAAMVVNYFILNTFSCCWRILLIIWMLLCIGFLFWFHYHHDGCFYNSLFVARGWGCEGENSYRERSRSSNGSHQPA